MAGGCGQKSFPRAIHKETMQIGDLRSQVRSGGVHLAWSIPDRMLGKARQPRYRFVVQRAEIRWEERNCPDCPALYQELQVIDPARPEPAVLEGKRLILLDGNVHPNHAYRYQVGIQDENNATLAKVVPAPDALARLTARSVNQGILVQWQKPPKDQAGNPLRGEVRFVVERLAAGKSAKWENVSPVPIDGSEYLDTSAAATQVYDYRVTPVLVFEETQVLGEPVLIQQAKAPDTLTPPPPQDVWVIPGKGHLQVHWIESEGRVMGYHVYRRQGEEIIRLTANPVGRPPFVDSRARKNETYSYAVSAVSTDPQHREGLLSKWVEIRNIFAD
jgi:hypothetical protein